jgi:hypothetical protein
MFMVVLVVVIILAVPDRKVARGDSVVGARMVVRKKGVVSQNPNDGMTVMVVVCLTMFVGCTMVCSTRRMLVFHHHQTSKYVDFIDSND